MGSLITKLWSNHGVLHFPSAIFHPQSVELSEHYVQMLVGRIGLSCISQGSAECWGQEIRNSVLSMNSRWIRVHGLLAAEILMGFNPAIKRKSDTGIDDWWKPSVMEAGDILQLVEDSTKGYMDIRQEQRNTMGRRLAHHQDELQSRKTVGYVTPKVGDLVLLRDHQLAKSKGRKLDPRWSTPRIVEPISYSGVSAHICQLHDQPGVTKRFHFDDLLVYVPGTSDYLKATMGDGSTPAVEYIRGAMGNVNGIWREGQRGFDLSDTSF